MSPAITGPADPASLASPDVVEVLVGHTRGPAHPVHHAWRCGRTEPDPQLIKQQADPEAPDHGDDELASRKPLDGDVNTELVQDVFGNTRVLTEGITVALCGLEIPHTVGRTFDPDHEMACPGCAQMVRAYQEAAA